MVGTLKSLLRRHMEGDDIMPIFKQMSRGSDRSAALLGCTLVEMSLYELIRKHMRQNLSPAQEGELFGTVGPVSSFYARTRIAYAFEIIGPATTDQLDRIREIRNVFAHAPTVVSFKTPEVEVACSNLWGAEVADGARATYRLAVKGLTMHLWSKTIDNQVAGLKMVEGLD